MAIENAVENVEVSRYGCIAQRVDRLGLKQKVSGSNPTTSNFLQCLYLLFICLWFGIWSDPPDLDPELFSIPISIPNLFRDLTTLVQRWKRVKRVTGHFLGIVEKMCWVTVGG